MTVSFPGDPERALWDTPGYGDGLTYQPDLATYKYATQANPVAVNRGAAALERIATALEVLAEKSEPVREWLRALHEPQTLTIEVPEVSQEVYDLLTGTMTSRVFVSYNDYWNSDILFASDIRVQREGVTFSETRLLDGDFLELTEEAIRDLGAFFPNEVDPPETIFIGPMDEVHVNAHDYWDQTENMDPREGWESLYLKSVPTGREDGPYNTSTFPVGFYIEGDNQNGYFYTLSDKGLKHFGIERLPWLP